jgi:hypothetical protein
MPTLPNIARAKVFVLVLGGGTGDGGGWGITPGGKLKKIPDNNPGLRKLAAAQAVLTQLERVSLDTQGRALLDAATATFERAAEEVAAGLE